MSLSWCITRPQPEAGDWAQRLQAAGIAAQALPLLAIGPAPDAAVLQARIHELQGGRWQAAMFVSANAARGLLGAAPGLAAAFGTGLRAWSPGPGTARLLVELGIAPTAIDQPVAGASQFDSESLWQQVAPQARPGFGVLIVRGADESGQAAGRDWLMRQVRAAGGQVADVAAYARTRPAGLAGQLRALDAARAGRRQGWLFSSSHAVTQLRALAEAGEWQHDWTGDVVLCTHERIAQAASALGLGTVKVCRPAFDDVRMAMEQLT